MEQNTSEKKFINFAKRAKSFQHAFRGIRLLLSTQRNVWIHVFIGAAVVILGFYFSLNMTEWIFIIFAIGSVLTAEAFNTALEIDMDLTSPGYHPYARNTKDMAAGAVLITAIASAVIGIMIFGPKILSLFRP